MKYYSNEIVFRGHPDKVCDQISAAILAACMKQDPNTRAGIEVMGGKGKIFLTGEVTTAATIDTEAITKRVLADVGYSTDYEIIDNIGKQSADIALGVDVGGAGDQGMMFGYACKDTPELLPTAMVILQKLAKAYDKLRQHDKRFLPDGKAQITGVYDGRKLVSIKDFTISYQNTEEDREQTDAMIKAMALSICFEFGIIIVENWHINPTGKFLIGGFEGDAGLTGRKIVVDAYQSFANVGGGCMNGKDPTKVDFSAAHCARAIAKHIVEQNAPVEWCEVQLSYAIGLAEPLAIYIKSNLGEHEPPDIYSFCTPAAIIDGLNLREADFEALARFGHFTD